MSKKNSKKSAKKGNSKKKITKAKPAKKNVKPAKKAKASKKAAPKKSAKPKPAKKAVKKKASPAKKSAKKATPVKKKAAKKIIAKKKTVKAVKKVSKPVKKAVKPAQKVSKPAPKPVKKEVKAPIKSAPKAKAVKKPAVSTPKPQAEVKKSLFFEVRPEKVMPEPAGKFELEYIVHSSAPILFDFLTSPSGLSQWFCDDVNIRNGIYSFMWDNNMQNANLVKAIEESVVRYQWADKNDGSYFEFRIERDDLTNDISLIVVDFADSPEERHSSTLLWNSQIDKLLHALGSFY